MNRQQRRKDERDAAKGGKVIPINGEPKAKPQAFMMEKRNAYVCPKCNHLTLTVHIHEGTIPMFLLCPNGSCDGMALSFAYRLPPCLMISDIKFGAVIDPSHEWYTPSKIEFNMLSNSEKNHIRKGGLLFRERTDAEPFKYPLIPQQQ